jgi:hypothetical protein
MIIRIPGNYSHQFINRTSRRCHLNSVRLGQGFKPPSLFRRGLNLVCALALLNWGGHLIVKTLPQERIPGSITKVAKATEFPLPVNLLLNLSVYESLIYLLLKRRQFTLGHELGHVLAERHAVRNQGQHFLQEPEHPVMDIYPIMEMLKKRGSGESHKYSVTYEAQMDELAKAMDHAWSHGTLFNPENLAQRKQLQQSFRDYGMILSAGPMLEGYLMGRTLFGGKSSDNTQRLGTALMTALLEKPVKAWNPISLARFVRDELSEHNNRAKAFLDGLNPDFVRRLYATMKQQLLEGHSTFTNRELEALIEGASKTCPMFTETTIKAGS